MKKYTVVWDDVAKEGLKEICKHIKRESKESAIKVRKAVLLKTNELKVRAEMYEQDRFKLNNDGSYRAFEQYSCRVTYKIVVSQVRILRVKHASQNPIIY